MKFKTTFFVTIICLILNFLIFLPKDIISAASAWSTSQGGTVSSNSGLRMTLGPTTGGFAVDTDHTLLNQLSAYWKLDETSGSRIDSIGGNTLTDHSSVGSTSSAKQGKAGAFVRSNDEYLSAPDSASLSTGDIDFSISTWVYMTSKPTGNANFITKNNGAAPKEYSFRWNQSNDRFLFTIFDSAGNTVGSAYADTLGSPTLNTWYFLVGWHDSVNNTVNIQVNNGAINTAVTTGVPADTTAQFQIGSQYTTNMWDGRVDEVGFWKKKLSIQEKTDLYNGGAGTTYSSGSSPTLTVNGHTGPVSFALNTALGATNSITSSQISFTSQYSTSYTNNAVQLGNVSTVDYYTYLKNLIGSHSTISTSTVTSLSGNISLIMSAIGGTFNVWEINNNLTISAGTTCDLQGIFFVTGRVTITPELISSGNIDRCVFISKTGFTINTAKTQSQCTGSTFSDYNCDNINGMFITNGDFTTVSRGGGADVPLDIIGTVFAKDLILNRDLGTYNSIAPAQNFIFDATFPYLFSVAFSNTNYSLREITD